MPEIVHIFTQISHVIHKSTFYKAEAEILFQKELLGNRRSTIRTEGSISGCVPSLGAQETSLYDTND